MLSLMVKRKKKARVVINYWKKIWRLGDVTWIALGAITHFPRFFLIEFLSLWI